MLRHPLWNDVLDISQLQDDPRLTDGAIIRDVRSPLHVDRGGLVTVLYSLDRSDWHLDALINRAATSGAGAVLLEGTAPLWRSTQALASRFHLPVLGSDDPLVAYDRFRQVTGRRQVYRAETTLEALFRVSMAGPRAEDVIAEIARLVRAPVALVDSAGTVIAGDHEIAQRLRDHADHLRLMRRFQDSLLTVNEGVIVVKVAEIPGTRVWLAAYLADGDVDGSDEASRILSVAVPFIEKRLAVSMIGLEQDARRQESLLGDLNSGVLTDDVRRRAVALGWELDGWHTGVQMRASDDDSQLYRRPEVLAAFHSEGLKPVVVEVHGGWSAWFTATSEPSAREVAELATRIRRVHHNLAAQMPIQTGVGRPHMGPGGIAETLGEAGDAARLARSRPETGYFLHVDRLGLAQLLLAWTRTDTFQPAARALLEPLANGSGDLLATLTTYLDCESNIAETAAVLGVHRNTVASRVHRIQETLRVDLASPNERLALHLACRTIFPRLGTMEFP